MAQLQYIGARYVPVLANPLEWDVNRVYEPLTIVTYYGTSYTSRKTVPAGTPLSNTEFWAVTGNYNAQVAQLDTRISALDNTVQNLSNNFYASNVDYLSNKKILLIGDSYNLQSTSWGGWGPAFAQAYPYVTSYSYAEGGGGFANPGDTQKTFQDLLTQAANDLSTAKKTELTDILVLGGYNDMSTSQSQDNITTAIANFLAVCQTDFPYAKLHIGFIGADYNLNGNEFKCLHYASIYKNACNICGIHFVDNCQYILLDSSLLLLDGSANAKFHPNTAGCQTIARLIPQMILGGFVDVKYQLNHANFTLTLHNDYCTINGNDTLGQTYFSAPALPNGQWTTLFVFGTPILWGSPQYGLKTGTVIVNLTDHLAYIANLRYNTGVWEIMQDGYDTTLPAGLYGYIPTVTAPTEFFY